uniref:PRP1 splicing factor N-terminal domain-containing protein n=1 Tax=Arcella intermedia TaxID=1963864 RepID=A0A6B2KXN3_9EUKA
MHLADDEVGLFSGMAFDEDDEEADKIYNSIDERMDSKRKMRREQLLKEKVKKFRAERPKIQLQFADLKSKLSEVTYEQWDALSDPGDISHKNKKPKYDRYTPTPNSLLEEAHREKQSFVTLDHQQQLYGGFATPIGAATPLLTSATPVQDLTKVGEAKQTIMMTKLAQASDSVTGQTSINPKGYLTDLLSIKVNTAAEVGDIKQARLLLDSVITSNPSHAPGWIARARLEEADGKIVRARKIIAKGCSACPTNEDVWLEAAQLNNPDDAKNILAQAVHNIPSSVKLWLAAAKLELDPNRKKRVLRKALENVPNSAILWKTAVELEKPEDARIMLSHAVECIPSSVEMWLALAKLETYENAKKVLNKARATIPTEKTIWVTAAQLEEANGNKDAVFQLIRKAVKSLASYGVQIDREEWIAEAEKCEKAGSVETCRAIILETIALNVEDDDRKSTWCEDAENALGRNSIETARAIYTQATSVLSNKQSLWLRLCHLEKKYGDNKSLEDVLAKSVQHCTHSETLWLMYAKHKWTSGDVEGARKVLTDAFAPLQGNEKVWLAAVKLEKENNEFERAREVLERARSSAGTARIWMKSALLERELKNTAKEESLLLTSLAKFPDFPKFYLMLAQLYERTDRIQTAKNMYTDGIKKCKNFIPLWIGLTRLEEKHGNMARSRAIMEKARLKNPKNQDLWLESIRVEARSNESPLIAMNMLAKALQECPKSGTLWAEAIEMEPKAGKKAKSVDALKRCDQDPHVILAVAKLFWQNRQIEKARMWFNRALGVDPDFGDAWAASYKFELQNGTPETQQEILKRCKDAEPHHGEVWISVSKDINNSNWKTEQLLLAVALKINVQ